MNKLISIENVIRKYLNSIKYIKIDIPTNKSLPENFPFVINDRLNLLIDVSNGYIIDSPQNFNYHINLYVYDQGNYELLDENKEIIAARYQSCVPDYYTLPGKYSEIINLNINNGKIINWYSKNKRTYKEFIEQ